jgi:three-Cys-motif partner protein
MPGPSAIEWTESTWNPVTGCSKVSPGCAHCYAETFAERWRGIDGHPYEQGFDLRLWPSRLAYPLKWKKPRIIFVNSMSDLFHEDIPDSYVSEVFEVMRQADHHIYQVLTKRPERMAELAPELPWPEHIWMGVTIENRRFVKRADYLREVPAAVRFISAEPLLGPLEGLDLSEIHWLIAGGESGPRFRRVREEWIRELRDLCLDTGVPFFFKQWGGVRAKSGGRLFEGQEWNGMPEHRLKPVLAPTGAKVPRKRQKDIPDSADEKWEFAAHTEAKHEILRRYLGAWLSILGRGKGGRQPNQLILIDGFAGRGRYMEGQPGSPAVMFERATQVVDDGLAKKVLIRCSEPDSTNFGHLQKVSEGLKHDKVTLSPSQETFEDVAQKFLAYANKPGKPPPTFVMVDPYGVKGVKLDTLKQMLAFDRVEVLLTFMVRDPSRFLKEGNYAEPLTALFGGTAWKDCEDAASDRPECLMRRFREIVVPAVAKYALPFTVFEDERKTILYYLVHLTNNDLGMREMKKAMVKKHGEMTFYPITLRPQDQFALDVSEEPPFPSLQQHLSERYAGETISFLDLLNVDYPVGHSWLEGEYKKALKAMFKESPPRVEIDRQGRKTETGREPTGLEHVDLLHFPA